MKTKRRTLSRYCQKRKIKLEYFGNIINTHTHIYPAKIAQKATVAIGDFYDLPMDTEGSEERLKKEMSDFGIKRCFLLSTATVPQQVRQINNFLVDVLARNGTDKFTAFGTVHPLMNGWEEEMDYMKENGIAGIKFHHDFIGIAADDPVMFKIYEKAQAEKTPVYLHAGDKRYKLTNPVQLRHIYDLFPNIIIIAAHFGGYSVWDDVIPLLKDTGFYFDTSSTLDFISPEKAADMISRLGHERFFFGTDFPMWEFEKEWNRFLKLPLGEDILESIAHVNAEKFLLSIK